MESFDVIAWLGAVVLAGALYARRLDDGLPIRFWGLAYACLYAAGVGTIWWPAAWAYAASDFFFHLFVALSLAGAMSFARGSIPRWLIPLYVGSGVLRVGLMLNGHPDASLWLSAPLSGGGLLAAAGYMWWGGMGGHAPLSQRLLAPAYFGMTVVDGFGLASRVTGADFGGILLAWATLGAASLLLQVLAITERSQRNLGKRRRDLEAERRTLRSVIETAPVGIFLFGVDRRLKVSNRRGAVLLDALRTGGDSTEPVEPTELMNRIADRASQRDDVDRLRAQSDTDPGFALEDLALTIPGDPDRHFRLSSGPVESDDGERLGRVWIASDETEHVRLQDELQRAQRMETLGTLAGGIAHDFNNQLTTIIGNARLALEELGAQNELARDSLEEVERAAEHCAELTGQLLAFARRVPIAPHAVSVEPAVREVEGLLRAMVPPSTSFTVKLDDDLWPALVDPSQLQQVILNLAINARDAGGGSGTIRIEVRNRSLPDPPVRDALPGTAPGRFIEVSVHDTGPGIDARTRERMFDPFFTTKGVGHGTGLGLAVVYGVVSSHNGWVDVESQPDRGTSIRAFFPVAAEESELEGGAAEPSLPTQRHTVLLADDDEGVRRLARHTLERMGHDVIEACDGDAAVESFVVHGASIDLAILDFAMPGRDGLAAIAEIRKQAPAVPVVLVSGFLDGADRVRSVPGVKLLSKPFRSEALEQAVAEALGEERTPDQPL